MSVLEGEQVTVEDTGGRESFILANESVLMRGLILRSWSNQISIRFRSDQQHNSGFILLHYQGESVPHYSNLRTIKQLLSLALITMDSNCLSIKYVRGEKNLNLYADISLRSLC